MKEDELNPTVLTVILSEERGHAYQFQTSHDLAVFRSACLVHGLLLTFLISSWFRDLLT